MLWWVETQMRIPAGLTQAIPDNISCSIPRRSLVSLRLRAWFREPTDLILNAWQTLAPSKVGPTYVLQRKRTYVSRLHIARYTRVTSSARRCLL